MQKHPIFDDKEKKRRYIPVRMARFKSRFRTAARHGAKSYLSMRFFEAKRYGRGDVEVFDLSGHPKAKWVHEWSHLDGANDERTRFVAVLEIPPVVSAETAVRV